MRSSSLPYFILKKRFPAGRRGRCDAGRRIGAPDHLLRLERKPAHPGRMARTLTKSTAILLEVGDNASLYALLAKHLGPRPLATDLS